MRLVLDTNILVAGLNFDGLCRLLVRRAARTDDLYTSEALLRELEDVLVRKFSWSEEKAKEASSLFRAASTVIEPGPLSKPVCRDHDDDHVISVGLHAQADMVVTGDKDLLVLGTHEGLRFVAPKDYWDLKAE